MGDRDSHRFPKSEQITYHLVLRNNMILFLNNLKITGVVLSLLIVLLFSASPNSVVCAQAAGATKIQAIKFESSKEWVVLRIDFDKGIPEYRTEKETDADKLVVYFINTDIRPAGIKPNASIDTFPLWKMTPYQGSANSSLTIYTAYDCELLIGKTEKTLLLKFPREVSYSRQIDIAEGVSWNTYAEERSGKPLRFDWLEVRPGARAKLAVKSTYSLDRKRRTMDLTEMCAKSGALAGINAGYFSGQGVPVSTLVEDSLFLTSGRYPTRPMMLALKDGTIKIGRFTVRPELVSGDKFISLTGLNCALSDSATVVYNWNYPFEEIPLEGFVYLLKNGTLSPISGGITELISPNEYYIVSLLAPEANPLARVGPSIFNEVRCRIFDRDTNELLEVVGASGGGPMLVSNGVANVTNAEDFIPDNISKGARARTAMAVLKDGTVMLVIVSEIRESFYKGVELQELASWFVKNGAVTAFNLDGGGSSQLVVSNRLVTPYSGTPRKINNAILVMPN